MENLRNCPFCGGENIYVDGYDHAAGKRWRVVCLDCMATVDPGTIQQKYCAIEAWNRRSDGWIPVAELPRDINDEDVYCIANQAGAISAVRGKDMSMAKRSGCTTWFKNNGPLPQPPKGE